MFICLFLWVHNILRKILPRRSLKSLIVPDQKFSPFYRLAIYFWQQDLYVELCCCEERPFHSRYLCKIWVTFSSHNQIIETRVTDYSVREWLLFVHRYTTWKQLTSFTFSFLRTYSRRFPSFMNSNTNHGSSLDSNEWMHKRYIRKKFNIKCNK